MRIASSCVVTALAMTIAAPATAQTPEAEVLFREGQRLMKEEQYSEACEKFEASERIEPASGTELNLALCREKNGQTASAWAMYLKAAASARKSKNEDRASEAKERANKLADQLVYLTIEVPGDVEVEGLVIKRNKTIIDHALWDQKVPVDPDEYTITAEAPGYKKWSDTVTVKTKSKVVEIPVLEKRKTPPGEGKEPPDRREEQPTTVHVQKYRTAAITLAVIGGGGLVLGTGIGLYARNQEEQSDLLCPNIQCSDPDGVALNQRARSAALGANISWALGGAALIAAGIVWYVGQSDDQVSVAPVVSDDGAGVTVGGRF